MRKSFVADLGVVLLVSTATLAPVLLLALVVRVFA
jgi:hypothetical protein